MDCYLTLRNNLRSIGIFRVDTETDDVRNNFLRILAGRAKELNVKK